MKKHVVALGIALCLASGGAFAASKKLDFEIQDLPIDRTSMEYGAQIQAFSAKVVGRKWVSEDNIGFVFYEIDNPYKIEKNTNRVIKDGYFFNIHKYMYDRVVLEYEFSNSRQSRRVGFIEFESRYPGSSVYFHLIDDNTLEMVTSDMASSSSQQIILKKVDDFPKQEKDAPRLKSAKERGTWY
ncbi:MAG: hypothetical protein ACN6P1_07805 [Pseudomonas sp.]|uniref:hypothetical protein n=1 Tax=Pseudomonas sp. TaxID=306 RepID=UPI003D0E726A